MNYTKAFDNVQHKELEILGKLDLHRKVIEIIRNVHENNAMQIQKNLSEYTKRERKLQGYVLSLDLFNLYNKIILWGPEALLGFIISGHNFNNRRQADDTLLSTNSEEKLKEPSERLVNENKKEKNSH